MSRAIFRRYAWGLLAYNLVVVIWGAFVRASFSGDGCGANWPMCGDTLVPRFTSTAKAVEFAHRVSSGLVIPLVAILIWLACRLYARGHRVRLGAFLCMAFTLSEAILGAGLVLFKWVAHNPSGYRAIATSAHLVNTFLLLGVLTLTAAWSSGAPALRLRSQSAVGAAVAVALIATLIVCVSGTLSALGDMLYPAHSIAQGLRADFAPDATVLLRLRPFHPLVAIATAIYLVWLGTMLRRMRPSPATARYAKIVTIMFGVQICAGTLNLWMLAPVWMQLVHLLIADLLWITIVLLSAAALADTSFSASGLRNEVYA